MHSVLPNHQMRCVLLILLLLLCCWAVRASQGSSDGETVAKESSQTTRLIKIGQLLGSGSTGRGGQDADRRVKKRGPGLGNGGHGKFAAGKFPLHKSPGQQHHMHRQRSDTPLFRRLNDRRRLVLFNNHTTMIPSIERAAQALKRTRSLQKRILDSVESILRTRNHIARARKRLDQLVLRTRVLSDKKIQLTKSLAKLKEQARKLAAPIIQNRKIIHLTVKNSELTKHIKRLAKKQRHLVDRIAALRKRKSDLAARYQDLAYRVVRQFPRWNLIGKRTSHSLVYDTLKVIPTAYRPTSKQTAGSTAPYRIISADRMKEIRRMISNPERRFARAIAKRLVNIRRHVHNEERIMAMKDQMTRLESRRRQLLKRIAGLRSRLGRLMTRMGLLKQRQGRWKLKMKKVESDAHAASITERINSAIQRVNDKILMCRQRIRQLHQRRTSEKQRIERISLRRQRIKRHIANLQRLIENENKRISHYVRVWARRLMRYGALSRRTMFSTVSTFDREIAKSARRVNSRIGKRLKKMKNGKANVGLRRSSASSRKMSDRKASSSSSRSSGTLPVGLNRKIKRLTQRVELNHLRMVQMAERQKLLASRLRKLRLRIRAIRHQIVTMQAGREHLGKHNSDVRSTVPGSPKVKQPDTAHIKLISSGVEDFASIIKGLSQKQGQLRGRMSRLVQRQHHLQHSVLAIQRRRQLQMKRLQSLLMKRNQ